MKREPPIYLPPPPRTPWHWRVLEVVAWVLGLGTLAGLLATLYSAAYLLGWLGETGGLAGAGWPW